MSKNAPSIDLSVLERASQEFERRETTRRIEECQELERRQRREVAAWKLLDNLTQMEQKAGRCQLDQVPFDHSPFVGPLVEAFFEVCDVMREASLGPELNLLDVGGMVAHYGRGRDPELVRIGGEAAIKALLEGVANRKRRSLRKQLAKTLETLAGRYLWYMTHPIVRGLLIRDYPLLRSQGVPPQVAHIVQFQGRNALRNYQWWNWHEEGLKPAAIRDRWNSTHPDEKIGQREPGRDLVRKTLEQIKRQIPSAC